MSAGGGKKTRQFDDWMPEELTVQILSRLPTFATVGRCRCVSKSWHLILSDPKFIIKSIMSPPPSTAKVMIARSSSTTSRTTSYSIHSSSELRLLDSGTLPERRLTIVGCAGGIFCLGDCTVVEGKIVLWNPANSETHTLPSIRNPVGFRHGGRFVNPIGFGFDPVRNDYKVLVSLWTNTPEKHQFFVYSLQGKSYKEVKGTPWTSSAGSRVVQSLSGSPAKCHWLSEFERFTSFDMSKEEFTELRLPLPSVHMQWPLPMYCENSFHMGKDESCLIAVSSRMKKGNRMFVDVWTTPSYVALAEGRCSWIRLYNVEESFPADVFVGSFTGLKVSGLWKRGKVFAYCTTGLKVCDRLGDKGLGSGRSRD